MIIKIDETTLGKKGQVVSTTKLTVQCDECKEKEWNCVQSNLVNNKTGRNICQSCKNKLGISGMKGKKHSDQTIKQFKNGSRAGDNNISKRKDVREKISKKLKGREAPWMKGVKRPEHAKKMSELMSYIWSYDNEYRNKLLICGRTHSKLHDEIKDWLLKYNFLNFESEQIINDTKFIVDEVDYINKVIININGDYWHCNPSKYKANDKIKHNGIEKLAKDIWKRDMIRDKILASKGYEIITIWESDFRKNKENILNKLKTFYE